MSEFLLVAALCVLGTVALGLVAILRGPTPADRLSAAQLLGTGGVAALLLLGVATDTAGVTDLALVLALLAAFAAVAFVTQRTPADVVAEPASPPAQEPE
ncbi:monovalent cation/H+ antiporter complex subunit F [uncultured Thiodictyon sp.]|uniref:monovalent cation/H+ antiporter complex subunit F n=1 Tax=uncultured Thiodictyon sp. TaxID=1846217 RepID=UPI0025F34C19|nr:monovalent cation/H+ antiporter complex subunit F [uncultured Thiodictyon sp.]